jgi:hypothetical protein
MSLVVILYKQYGLVVSTAFAAATESAAIWIGSFFQRLKKRDLACKLNAFERLKRLINEEHVA